MVGVECNLTELLISLNEKGCDINCVSATGENIVTTYGVPSRSEIDSKVFAYIFNPSKSGFNIPLLKNINETYPECYRMLQNMIRDYEVETGIAVIEGTQAYDRAAEEEKLRVKEEARQHIQRIFQADVREEASIETPTFE